MEPGKARRVPVPMRFLRRLVTKAIPTAYQGPKKTPPSILMKCWTGAHLEAPTGAYNSHRNKDACQGKLADIYTFHIDQNLSLKKISPGLIVSQSKENLKKICGLFYLVLQVPAFKNNLKIRIPARG